MDAVDREGFASAADALDEVVRVTPSIDHFCSSSAWVLSASAALMPPHELFVRRGEHGWVVLARLPQAAGVSGLVSLEAVWCLACPFAHAGDPANLAREFAAVLAREVPSDVLFLSGLPVGSPLLAALREALGERYHLDTSRMLPTVRFRASLEGGTDGFLARRSTGFRARLRQADRKARQAGVTFSQAIVHGEDDALALYERMLALEARSWKGKEGSGLAVPEMEAFYRMMLERLAHTNALRVHVGTFEEQDVAMIMGAVIATPDGVCYRGLQFSFDDAHRALSLGNLAQLAQITLLSTEGVALYDLGSEVDYKRRWGELCLETVTLVAIPRGLRHAA